MKESMVLAVLIIGSLSLPGEKEVGKEFQDAILRGLASSIQNHLPTFMKKIKDVYLEKEKGGNTGVGVNSTIINRGVGKILSETLPVLPFAVVEPTSLNIQTYFRILDSYYQCGQSTVNSKVTSNNLTTTINIDLHISESGLTGLYELDVSSYDMRLYGNGNYSMQWNNTIVNITTSFNTFPDNSFLMTDFLLELQVKDVQLTMRNMLNGDTKVLPVIYFIQQLIPTEIKELDSMMQSGVNQTVTNFTNNYLAKIMSWSELIWLIHFIADL